ncbi:MAG: hypothetical protein H0S80_11765 [Desulfovibrionaceae bacterium]|nr:hypothetical protein [Desulfovibrionaceae bacterium]
MQGKNRHRLNVLGTIGLVLLAWAAVASAGAGKARMAEAVAVTANPVGLVMDSRANAYTVDRVTGKVFCLPAGDDPVHYATIAGEPTALAVDRRGTLYIGTSAGLILAVRRDGTVREACRCDAPVTGLTVDRDGGLLIATGTGKLVRKSRTDLRPGRPG